MKESMIEASKIHYTVSTEGATTFEEIKMGCL